MNTQKHTPGPWEVDEARSCRPPEEYFVRRPGDNVAIASEIIDAENGGPAQRSQPTESRREFDAMTDSGFFATYEPDPIGVREE
jgi:hypothetical protein